METHLSAMRKHSFWFIGGLLLACFLGIGFRFWNIGSKPIWFDEVLSLMRASGYTVMDVLPTVFQGKLVSPDQILAYQRPSPEGGWKRTITAMIWDDPHHTPFYFLLLRALINLFGSSPAIARSLSAGLSLLVPVAVYLLSWELWRSFLAAWSAAILFWLSPFQVLYAQEVREYSLWMAMTLLSWWALLCVTRTRSWKGWGIYGISALLGFYSHPLFAMVFVGHLIYVVVVERAQWRQYKLPFSLVVSLVLFFFAPWGFIIFWRSPKIAELMAWTTKPATVNELSQYWLRNLTVPFFDLNQTLLPAAETIFQFLILFLEGYAAYWLIRYGGRQAKTILILLIVIPWGIFIGADLVMGGMRSTIARFLSSALLGLQLTVAYLIANFLSLSGSQKRKAYLLLAILCLSETASSWKIVHAETWWHRQFVDHIPQAVRALNQFERPLILADRVNAVNYGNIFSLSYLLTEKARFVLGITPDVKVIQENCRCIACDTVFWLNPTGFTTSGETLPYEVIIPNVLWKLGDQGK